MEIPETGFIENVNSVAENIAIIQSAADLFDINTVSILQEIADLDISVVVDDLKKANYLGNRKLDINLALNNLSTTTLVAYQQANVLFKDGVTVNIPFQEQQEDLSWVTLELTSHADIKNYITTDAAYLAKVQNTEVTVEDAIGDSPQLIRFRDTDGYSSNVDRVDLVTYSGSYINATAQHFWTATTSSLQTLTNRAADILLLGQSIDDIIVLANITDDVEAVASFSTELVAIYADLANIISVYNNLTNIATAVGMAGNITTVIAMTANIDAVLADSVNIAAVAGAAANMATIVANMASILAVEGNATNINTTVGMESNIATVVGAKANIDIVAADIVDINSVAADEADIGSVAANIANVNTVATNIANVNAVQANIAVVTDVSNNMGDVTAINTDIIPNLAEILLADTNAALATTSKDQASTHAGNASTDATNAAISAGQALTYLNQITALTTATNTLVAGSQASSSYNSGTGVLTLGIPKGDKGDQGDAFNVDAFGTLAGRVTYDDQALGFAYLAVDNSNIYFKQSASTADWSAGVPFGKGDTGAQGDIGLGWLSGNGVPSDLSGVDGEYYLDIDTADIYNKVGGTWGASIMNLAAAIDDGSVSTLLAWSSTKITAELALKSNSTHNHSGVYEPADPGIQSHIANVANPHGVDKGDVGLGNVNNTSDLAKPISTATQTALDDKVELDQNNTLTGINTISAAVPQLRLSEIDQAVDAKNWDIAISGSDLFLRAMTDVWGLQATPLTLSRNGNANFAGTVDGRDIAADGTKLDGLNIGSTIAAYAHTHAGVYEPADATILKSADIGVNVQAYDATLEIGANKYVHPAHAGDDINLDTTLLTGAQVISDLDFNVTTDLLGHVTDANAAFATRNLTLADLGYTGAVDANNYVHPSYAVTNINTSGVQIVDSISTTAEGHVSAMSTRSLTKTDIDGLGINATTLDSIDSTQFARVDAVSTVTQQWNFNGGDGSNAPFTVDSVFKVTNLNADLLDGINSTSFLRSDAADIKTSGSLTFNDNLRAYFGSGNDSGIFHNGSHMYLDNLVGNLYFRDNTTTRFTFARTTGNFTATGNVTAYSDKRVKENIEPITAALSKVDLLNGYTFDRTDIESPRQTGVIAQEVQEVLPEAVIEGEDGQLAVAYGNMAGLFIEAIKELKQEVESLKQEVSVLKGE